MNKVGRRVLKSNKMGQNFWWKLYITEGSIKMSFACKKTFKKSTTSIKNESSMNPPLCSLVSMEKKPIIWISNSFESTWTTLEQRWNTCEWILFWWKCTPNDCNLTDKWTLDMVCTCCLIVFKVYFPEVFNHWVRTLRQKRSFPLRTSLVNLDKSPVSCKFFHIHISFIDTFPVCTVLSAYKFFKVARRHALFTY